MPPARTVLKRLAGVTCALALAASGDDAKAAAQGVGSLELAVKAAYLYKLAPFVTWPPQSQAAGATFVICVQGDESLADLTVKASTGQQVSGRSFEVRRLARVDRTSGCQIAYLAGSSVQSQAAALAALDSAGVLTVTDDARGGAARGVVHLVLDEGRVRFDIDDVAAAREGLSISSKLLSLAIHVRTR